MREIEHNRLNNGDFPHSLILLSLSPARSSSFRVSDRTSTILDIIWTSCAHVLSLRGVPSPPPHAARDRAHATASVSTFRLCVSQWIPLHAAKCSYSFHIVWQRLTISFHKAVSEPCCWKVQSLRTSHFVNRQL